MGPQENRATHAADPAEPCHAISDASAGASAHAARGGSATSTVRPGTAVQAPPAGAGRLSAKDRHCLSARASRGLRGRVLLARMSRALKGHPGEHHLVGCQTSWHRGARCRHQSAADRGRVGRRSLLGARGPVRGRGQSRGHRPLTTLVHNFGPRSRSGAATRVRLGAMTNTPQSQRTLSSIDLFCGAGGLTLGLSVAGFSSVLGLDKWEPAVATFERNFREVPAIAVDARECNSQDLLSKAGLVGPPDIIAGGPPCQGFSSAGARKTQDDRNTLVRTFAELVAEIRPRAFLFENVEGFLTAETGAFVIDLLDPLIEAGYRVRLHKVNVANYGVPQLRKRVIGIGLLHTDPDFPVPISRAHGAPGVHRVGQWSSLPMTPTVGETLEKMPLPADGPPGRPADHFAPKLGRDDLARIQVLRQGQTMRDLPAELRHPSYRRRAYRRVMDGTPTERRGGPPAGLRRLRGDEPAKAITGASTREFVHPDQDRPLTLRECARLQTFPDDFEFAGSRSERAVLIGNAVPPLFAAVLGATVAQALDAPGEALQGRGRLLSFETSVADGKSPALIAVEKRVVRRYGGKEPTLWS